MISIKATTNNFWIHDAASYIIMMKEGLESASDLSSLNTIEKEYYPHIKQVLKQRKFEGKKGQSYVLSAMRDNKLIEFILVGLGKGDGEWHQELEVLRRGLGSAIAQLKKNNISSAVVALPEADSYNVSRTELAKQMTILGHMADYEFAAFKQSKDRTDWNGELSIQVKEDELSECEVAINEGNIIGKAMNDARYWGDCPANIMTPTKLSEEAQKVADRNELKCTIFGRDRAIDLGMGAFLAVDAGSNQPGKFVVLEYQTTEKDAPTLCLVGKGVTFDTGGISLKPSNYMTGMKYDMSGAAAVIAAMNCIGQLKPNVNVVGITPLVENMPSGTATRQDDIVTAMNGKSIEIKNTDAEGRLILADALCYAEKFHQPDVMIDLATLTGACLYALGYFFSGLMTKDQALSDALVAVSKKTGDRIWPLPLDADFMPANKSEVADVANCGSPTYKAGTITAGCFLSNFVEKTPWAHLDIAGTADGVPGINYTPKGSTGSGIRLLVEYVMNYKK